MNVTRQNRDRPLQQPALLLILLLFSFILTPPAARAELDLASWTSLLQEAVVDGEVDYGQWANNPRFDALVEQIAATDISGMNREQQLVFFINSYNILAARGILDGSSPSSLIGRYLYFKRDTYTVAGEQMSLYQLEHEWIRPLKEPRIHFAIVCASQSCPILQDEAYILAKLDLQLESAAKEFINDPARNTFDVPSKRAELSSIFKWFAEDFEEAAGSLQQYLAPLVDNAEVAEMLRQDAFDISYLKYDWSLNGER